MLILAACSSGTEPVTTSSPEVTATSVVVEATSTSEMGVDRVAAWNDDLDLLLERLPLLHPDPYWRVGESTFLGEVEQLRKRIGDLSDDDIELELVRLMATIDGHTILRTNQDALDYERGQIRFYEFRDGVFVVASPDPAIVGGELVSVNGVPTEEALELVAPYVSYDNGQTIKNVAPLYLTIPDIQRGAGLLPAGSDPVYEIVTTTGETVEVEPELLTWDDWWRWANEDITLPARDGVFTDQMIDETFWWEYLPDEQTVYFQYNDVRSGVQNLVDEMEQVVATEPIQRIIVDMRRNPGGNNTTFGPLFDFLQEQDAMGVLVLVVLGRQTFSAAANFSTRLDVETGAIFFGEAMGGSPNLYGDTRPLTLPNSGVEVLISSRYWEFGGPDDTRDTITPEFVVEMSSSDYFSGLDPAFDEALSYDG